MRYRDDGDAIGDNPVGVDEIALERAVVRRDDGNAREPFRVQRPDQRVIVHDVDLARQLVGVHDVSYLLGRATRADADRALEDPGALDCAGALAGGVEQHLVAGCSQSPGETVKDGLGSTVGRWRNG